MRKCRHVNWRARIVVGRVLQKALLLVDHKKAEKEFLRKRGWAITVILRRMLWNICKRGLGRLKADDSFIIPAMSDAAFKGFGQLLFEKGMPPQQNVPPQQCHSHLTAVRYYHRTKLRHSLMLSALPMIYSDLFHKQAVQLLSRFLKHTGEQYDMNQHFKRLQKHVIWAQTRFKKAKEERMEQMEELRTMFDKKRTEI